MKKIIILLFVLITGCAQLQPVTKSQTGSLTNYKYVVIPNEATITAGVSSGSSAVVKELDPDNLIEGILLKKGLIRIDSPASNEKYIDKVLVVKYGVSGRRDVMLGMGYTMEVSIAIVSAKNLTPIYTCTAEGIGSTEVDDLRQAITRCLSGAT